MKRKQKSGFAWYKEIYSFLSKNECYIAFLTKVAQHTNGFVQIAKEFGGERVHADNKRYGFIVSRGGKKGNAVITTIPAIEKFCKLNNLDAGTQIKEGVFVRYTAKEFKDSHHSKNVYLKSEARKPYHKQLESEKWYAFRKFVFEVRGRKCEVCGATKELQVHHPKYISGRAAWEYSCNEVMVVCVACHQKIHNITE